MVLMTKVVTEVFGYGGCMTQTPVPTASDVSNSVSKSGLDAR